MTEPLTYKRASKIAQYFSVHTGVTWTPLTNRQYYSDGDRFEDKGTWYLSGARHPLAIVLNWDEYGNKGRYSVSWACKVGQKVDGVTFDDRKYPGKITFDPKRTEKDIAKDIARRYYPDFKAFERHFQERNSQRRQTLERTEQIKRYFAEAGLRDYSLSKDRIRAGHHYHENLSIDIEVGVYSDSESIQLKIQTKDFGDVVRVLSALQETDGLTELEVHHLIDAVKTEGVYDPDIIMCHFEEQLTQEQWDKLYGFLSWVHRSGSGFGHGNIQDRYAEYLRH